MIKIPRVATSSCTRVVWGLYVLQRYARSYREKDYKEDLKLLDKKEDDIREKSRELVERELDVQDKLQDINEKERNLDRTILESSNDKHKLKYSHRHFHL